MAIPAPHGGRLTDGRLPEARAQAIRARHAAGELDLLAIGEGTAREIANIASGLYSPLTGFMGEAELWSVLSEGRLPSGVPWTLPVLLRPDDRAMAGLPDPIPELVGLTLSGRLIAVLQPGEVFSLDAVRAARLLFGTADPAHPGAAAFMSAPTRALSGRVWQMEDLAAPPGVVLASPRTTRRAIQALGWKDVVAFQTRNAPHLGHEYIQKTALTFSDGLLISPVVGPKKAGDFSDEAIMKAYTSLVAAYYPPSSVLLAPIAYEMRYAGPKEAIHHAIMRKNLGCSKIVIGRDHAGVGTFYGPRDAQVIFSRFPDLGIEPVPFGEFYRCRRCGGVVNPKTCPHSGDDLVHFSGTRVRSALLAGEGADGLVRPEVASTLASIPFPFVGIAPRAATAGEA